MKESEFMQCHKTNEELECLKKLIELVESLPQIMCDEMEKREELCRQLRMKQVQDQLDFYEKNRIEINKMMYNCCVDLKESDGKD